MARDDRLWVAFSMQFDEHPKIAILSDAAFRALVEMIFYCRRNENDGQIPLRFAERKWGREVLEELAANDADKPSVSIAPISDNKQTASKDEANMSVASGCYVLLHDYLQHHPSKKELEARRNGISEARREAGRKGGLARAASLTSGNKQSSSKPKQASSNPLANVKQNVAKSKSKKDISYEISTSSIPASSTTSKREALEKEFEKTFWPAYPKKAGKQDAKKAFFKARASTDLETIMGGVQRYAAQPFTDPSLIKHAQGWLNGKRWEDELPTPQTMIHGQPVNVRVEKARSTFDYIDQMDWEDVA